VDDASRQEASEPDEDARRPNGVLPVDAPLRAPRGGPPSARPTLRVPVHHPGPRARHHRQPRAVITADEVLLLNSLDNYVHQYATELQRRLLHHTEGDDLLFEFYALELALEAACSFLDALVTITTQFRAATFFFYFTPATII